MGPFFNAVRGAARELQRVRVRHAHTRRFKLSLVNSLVNLKNAKNEAERPRAWI